MEKFVVKRSSWHLRAYSVYRAIVKPDFYEDAKTVDQMVDETLYMDGWNRASMFRDFCTYWRRVLFWPVFNLAVNAALVVTFFFLTSKISGDGGLVGLKILAVVLGMLLIACAISAAAAGAVIGIRWLLDRMDDVPSNSIFAKIHDSYKNKYCPMVELEEKSE